MAIKCSKVEPEAAEMVPVGHNQRADFIAAMRSIVRLLPTSGHLAVDHGQPTLRRAFNPKETVHTRTGHAADGRCGGWYSTCGVT